MKTFQNSPELARLVEGIQEVKKRTNKDKAADRYRHLTKTTTAPVPDAAALASISGKVVRMVKERTS